MGFKNKNTVTVTLNEAKTIVLAKAIETAAAAPGQTAAVLGKGWSAADSQAASAAAAHTLGEDASTARLLTERARWVLERARERGIASGIGTRARLPAMLAPLFVLGAFVIGALTDRLTGQDHLVNLLSPAFWTVIAWNLAVYLGLCLCAVGLLGRRGNRFALPLRGVLNAFVEKCAFSTLKRGWQARFYADWAQITTPLVRMSVAKTLHWAAVFFALGLIVSLAVRGFGTAYWVGWESTWLAENPQAVKTWIDFVYAPVASILGQPVIPDVDTLAQWRIDRIPFLKEKISAAPWLIAMMVVMAAVVILPRLVFIAVVGWRMGRFKRRVVLSLDDDYYGNLIAECRQDAHLGQLVIVGPATARNERTKGLEQMRSLWGNPGDTTVAVMDFYDAERPAPDLGAIGRRAVVLLWVDGVETPEDDVQGLAIDKARAAYTPEHPLAVWLDMSGFAARFAHAPDRIEQRTNTWRAFLAAREVPYFVMPLENEAMLAAVKKLRAWAAAQNASGALMVVPDKDQAKPQAQPKRLPAVKPAAPALTQTPPVIVPPAPAKTTAKTAAETVANIAAQTPVKEADAAPVQDSLPIPVAEPAPAPGSDDQSAPAGDEPTQSKQTKPAAQTTHSDTSE